MPISVLFSLCMAIGLLLSLPQVSQAWDEGLIHNAHCDAMAQTQASFMGYYGISVLNVKESIKYLGPSIRLRKVIAKAVEGQDIQAVILGGSVSCEYFLYIF